MDGVYELTERVSRLEQAISSLLGRVVLREDDALKARIELSETRQRLAAASDVASKALAATQTGTGLSSVFVSPTPADPIDLVDSRVEESVTHPGHTPYARGQMILGPVTSDTRPLWVYDDTTTPPSWWGVTLTAKV
jgi:hypothetical protein